jgi:hypothetical protein
MAHASHRPDVVCAASEAASVAAGGFSSLPIPVPANVVGHALVATGSSHRGYFGSTPLPQMSVAWLVADTSPYAQSRRRAAARHNARLRAQRDLLHNFYLHQLPRDAYVFYHNRRMYAHPDSRRPTLPVTTEYPGGESPFLPDPPDPSFLQGPARGTIWDMHW